MPEHYVVGEAAARIEPETIASREMQRKRNVVIPRGVDEPVLLGAMGWMRDLPDYRDFTPEHEEVKPQLEQTRALKAPASLPATADLRPWCTTIENQGPLGSCTANAGVGMFEYFIKRRYGMEFDLSRLFLYKVTRDLLHWTGDTGAYLRTTMGAMAMFGVPPEEYWQYNVAAFDTEPTAFCYAFAEDFKALLYYRLDAGPVGRDVLLARIKTHLASGLPSMFGFTVYNSIAQAAANQGKIPFPASGDRVIGGHAIVAVGYDDGMKITNTNDNAVTTGALLIRNSWGMGWGAAGYGWLPYDYVLRSLAVDWWSMISAAWVNTGIFK